MSYVDGFLVPVPKRRLKDYLRMARLGAKVWRDHGALDYRECVGDDLTPKGAVPFGRGLRLKPGETVIFAYIVFRSRAHRDRVNARVMKDPRLASMDPKSSPFDYRRMVYGGFKTLVSF